MHSRYIRRRPALVLSSANKPKAFITLAFVVPVLTNPLTLRQCAETCGSTCYSQDDINAAVQQGYGYYDDGTTVGSDEYPHQYKDYEGFSFPDAGPYYEFPILSNEQVCIS